MIELLDRVAAGDPDRLALIYLDRKYTYGELAETARRIASGLRERDLRRFVICDPSPAAVIPLLAAAALTGFEACIYPPTANAELATQLSEKFGHTLAVSPRPEIPFERIEIDDLTGPASAEAPIDGPRPHLVLTTGTTGLPRAAMHDWSRLLRSVDRVPDGNGQRWLLAYGMNQFGGLQVLLHVLASGATLVAPDVFTPRAGLDAIRQHGVTHASATPTFWRFLLAELPAGTKLDSLEQITMSGEAPSAPVLDRVRAELPGVRISQIYGANEFGTAFSVRDGVQGFPVGELDRTSGIVRLKIVDGELWVRSEIGMLGYYGETGTDPDGWRNMGDQVEIVDGRVLFRGRSSDVINVGGVKVHPLPIEERLATIPGVRLSRVFGRPNALTGSIVAVEVVAEPSADTDEIDDAIRAACAELPPAARPRSIRFVDSLKTIDNKIIRRKESE